MDSRSLRLLLLASFALLAFTSTAGAAPADVDTSFGNGGVAALPVTAQTGFIPTATQPDGKVLIGYTRKSDGFAELIRMNPDGTPDSSFGTGGKFALPQAGSDSSKIATVIALPSGRILVGGSAIFGGIPRMIVWAVTGSGALDTSFAIGLGYRLVAISGTSGNSTVGIGVQPDGDIAIAASVTSGGVQGATLQLLSASGAVGASAIKTFASPVSVTSMAVQPDGSAVIGGGVESVGNNVGLTMRFSESGAWDAGYGATGVSVFGFIAPILGLVYSVEIRPDGSILPVGQIGYSAAVQTLLPSGDIDTARDPFGIFRLLGPNTGSILVDGALVGGGRLLTAGISTNFSTINSPFVARFDANGAVDPTFASGVIPAISDKIGGISASSQTDGHYLVFVVTSDTGELKVVRLNGDHVAPSTPLTVGFGSIRSSQSAKKFKKFSGTASGTGLAKVQVAIQKIDSALLKKSKRCAFVKNSSGSTKRIKAVKGKCTPSVWLNATGGSSWSYALKKSLPAGRYKLFARASGAAGATSSTVSKSLTLKK